MRTKFDVILREERESERAEGKLGVLPLLRLKL